MKHPVNMQEVHHNDDDVLIECDLCMLFVSFSDYASHVESHTMAGEDYELNLMMQELMGRVEIGVDDIETVTHDVKLDNKTSIECPICLEEQEKIVKRTLCNHDFCSSCISKWLSKHKTCPICVTDIQNLL